MHQLRVSTPIVRLILGTILFTSSVCFADHFGGGFHGNVGNNNWNNQPNFNNNGWNHPNNSYHNDTGVGSYYPGSGWIAPTYIINSGTLEDSDCQTIQQCDSNGNCIQTQNCN